MKASEETVSFELSLSTVVVRARSTVPVVRFEVSVAEPAFLLQSEDADDIGMLDRQEEHSMRIQIEVPESDAAELKQLMNDLGVDTYKDLFSNAFTLLYWAAKETREGRTIAAVDTEQKTMKEILMPVLAQLARKREPAAAS